MITGFNTDVKHDGNVYHVQTEARGRDNPVLESLVYIGGTIVAKKMTPYADQLRQGATEEMIAVLLKRQHQVVIAAIRAGRINDLIRHSADEALKGTADDSQKVKPAKKVDERAAAAQPELPPPRTAKPAASPDRPSARSGAGRPASARVNTNAAPTARTVQPAETPQPAPPQPTASTQARTGSAKTPAALTATTGGLNLDEVISDYLKRSSEQGRLDLKVLAPTAFIAGKSIGLRVQASHEREAETGAIVTVKVIGTAFKPQVYLGRTGSDGVVSFNLVLPSFSAGTAAIVIEAQSSHGRGELKHLIRRA